MSSILFSIINLVFLALYYSAPYSAPYFLAVPHANQREKNNKERGEARPVPLFILAFTTRGRNENPEVFNLISAQMYKIDLGAYFPVNQQQIVQQW